MVKHKSNSYNTEQCKPEMQKKFAYIYEKQD